MHRTKRLSQVVTRPANTGNLLDLRRLGGYAAPVNENRTGGDDAYGRAIPYNRLSATPPPRTAAAATGQGLRLPPCTPPALTRLSVQVAVSAAAAWWACEGRRRGGGASTSTRSYPTPATSSSSRATRNIPRHRLLRFTRAGGSTPTPARITRWAPLLPAANCFLTTYHMSTPNLASHARADLVTLHQCQYQHHYPWYTHGQRPGSSPGR